MQVYDDETREVIKQRRIGLFKLTQAVSEITHRHTRAGGARNELVKLVKARPLLLGDPSAVAGAA